MKYTSTRNNSIEVSASKAIVDGISSDGGLYVPSSLPILSLSDIKGFTELSYPERAADIMKRFLDEFTYEELLDYCIKAYQRFEDQDACPLIKIDKGLNILELWHGPTHAFKDMALSVMPYLMTAARAKLNKTEKSLILVATSGDTGKAALEGFKDVENTFIMVFYPAKGVSPMQKLQMTTQEGDNVYVAAIDGNFDDAQTAVKKIFIDKDIVESLIGKNYTLSSANSINWGRLLPQIAYYVSAYVDLISSGDIALGDKVNFVVPTGNFGNILAAYYAKEMGLPVNKLICASNNNNVLTDFFISGTYNVNRKFYKTMSPSMDILISSNLERLLFEICLRDSDTIVELMSSLRDKGTYSIDRRALQHKVSCFSYGYSTEDETIKAIDNFFETYSYLLDPHTAVAMNVYNNYVLDSGDETPAVIVSTANPYKFPQDVYYAVSGNYIEDPFKAAKKLMSISAQDIPEDFLKLAFNEERFTEVYDISKVKDAVLNIIR